MQVNLGCIFKVGITFIKILQGEEKVPKHYFAVALVYLGSLHCPQSQTTWCSPSKLSRVVSFIGRRDLVRVAISPTCNGSGLSFDNNMWT